MKKNNSTSTILSILKGDFFSKKKNLQYIPFLFLVVSLLLINISLSFHAEQLLKKSIKLEYEVADLRLRYITTKSQLMSVYQRSAIESMVADQALYTSLNPPYIIDEDEK